jgi:antitoxin VapB
MPAAARLDSLPSWLMRRSNGPFWRLAWLDEFDRYGGWRDIYHWYLSLLKRRNMTATAKLFTHGRSQAVRLPKEFRFEGTEVRISKLGDKVVLEPVEKKPFDAVAWRAGLEEFRDIPFVADGRDQGARRSTPVWAEIDALRNGEDLFPEDGSDDPSAKPVEGGGS